MNRSEIQDASRNPFKVKIWTSSHGLGSHHFPQALGAVFKNKGLLRLPEINAVGGRYLDSNFVDTYRRDFEESTTYESRSKCLSHMSIILLGDNNIRSHAVKGAFRVVKSIGQIIEIHQNFYYPLLICGLMPSPRTEAVTGILSEYTDDKLQEKVIELHSNPEGRFYGYVCTTSFFTKITGPPVLNKHFSRDGIHLNEFGANVLALNLLSEANTLAKTVVGYPDFRNGRSA
jgi:hypothetical protein